MNIKSNKQYHPQMHSAEHILNQTMVRMFACGRSFSNHIEKKKSKCDYNFERALTESEIEEININKIIQQDLQVVEEFINREDAEEKFNLARLPNDSGDKIRIIKIGNYDVCPCSGLHVIHTKEIGRFHIYSTSFNDGVLRIRFKLFNE